MISYELTNPLKSGYRAGDRILTDSDIKPVHQQVREALVEKFRVELRS